MRTHLGGARRLTTRLLLRRMLPILIALFFTIAPRSALADDPPSDPAAPAPTANPAAPLAPASPPAPRPSAKSPEALFQDATAALTKGEYSAAIDLFEALADTGFAHPDASYNRGLAYVMRVRARADRPGDLGRAAAAFEEALLMRPNDADAERSLDLVRAEVTRRRARRAKDAVDVRPTLDRLVVGLASEQTWGIAAACASLLFAVGLVLRRRPSGPAHVAGSVLAPTAAIALLALVPLTWKARDLRLRTRPGVIIAPEVYLTDDTGRALGGDPIPEAASVETSSRQDSQIQVRWGAREGWVPSSSVRLLMR
jgi:hypothetical protein